MSEPVMSRRYFEDMQIGAKRQVGSYTFTAEDIIAFATKFDPQPFHLSEEGGRNSLFGGLCASGWHVGSVCMKMMVLDGQRTQQQIEATGEKAPVWGPSPGFRDLKWLKPVMAGDTISYASEVKALRASASRPEWGIVQVLNTGTNQHGELVYSFMATAFAPRRSPGG